MFAMTMLRLMMTMFGRMMMMFEKRKRMMIMRLIRPHWCSHFELDNDEDDQKEDEIDETWMVLKGRMDEFLLE